MQMSSLTPAMTVILVFSAIGILNTLYLSWHTITRAPVRCLFFPEAWCQKVQYSSWSRTFGIPNSFAGLGMYSAIAVLAVLSVRGVVPFWWVQVPIGVGAAFALYFTWIQAFVLRAFCTWCVVSAADFAVLATAAFVLA